MRLFFAVWPDAALRKALTRWVQPALLQDAGGRGSASANLHLTLAFLGEIAATRLPVLQTLAQRVAEAATAHDWLLDHTTVWKNGIGLVAGPCPTALARLAEGLKQALSDAGFAIEARRYRPHITLLRQGRPQPYQTLESQLCLRVDHLALVVSENGPQGVRYRTLFQVAFPPGPAA